MNSSIGPTTKREEPRSVGSKSDTSDQVPPIKPIHPEMFLGKTATKMLDSVSNEKSEAAFDKTNVIRRKDIVKVGKIKRRSRSTTSRQSRGSNNFKEVRLKQPD